MTTDAKYKSLRFFEHTEYVTSHEFRWWRFDLWIHRRYYWGDMLRAWGYDKSAGLQTPFSSLYFWWG
jgi:hypothetical protein